MRKRILIRIAERDAPFEASWVTSDGAEGEQPAVIKTGSLDEVAAAAAGARIVVLVPGSDVLLTGAIVPSSNRRRLLSAIPFALEDHLASDIEELHFAIGKREEQGYVNTAIVENQVMAGWLARLNEVGIQPEVVVPETLALPFAPNEWTLLVEDHGALLRTGSQGGFSIDTPNIVEMIGMAVQGAGEGRPTKLRGIDCRTVESAPLQVDAVIEVDWQMPHEPAVALMADHIDERQAIDLLQGEYSRREQLGRLWRPWRPAAAMVALVVAIQFSMAVAEHSQLQNEAASLKKQIDDVYLKTFTDAKKVVNPRVQMQRRLDEMRGGDSGDGAFLSLLTSVGKQFSEMPGINLDRLNYRAGQINVALKIQDLQKLDQLKQRLVEKAGLAIEIQSATSRDGKVEARMQIGKQGT